MRHTPDTEDVERMIERRLDRVRNETIETLLALAACARGNADQALSARDLEHVARLLAKAGKP